MQTETRAPIVRLSVVVWSAARKALQSLAVDERLPSVDEALNRLTEFYTPADSVGAVNHILFECGLILDRLASTDGKYAFLRALYEQFDHLLAVAESGDADSASSAGEASQGVLTEWEDGKYFYKEKPLQVSHNKSRRVPLTAEIPKTRFDYLKNSSDAMEMTIGELIDFLTLGFPRMKDPETEVLNILMALCAIMGGLSHRQYVETLRTMNDIWEFMVDYADDMSSPEDTERVLRMMKALDRKPEAELLKLRKWKYGDSAVAAFLGFFPGLSDAQE